MDENGIHPESCLGLWVKHGETPSVSSVSYLENHLGNSRAQILPLWTNPRCPCVVDPEAWERPAFSQCWICILVASRDAKEGNSGCNLFLTGKKKTCSSGMFRILNGGSFKFGPAICSHSVMANSLVQWGIANRNSQSWALGQLPHVFRNLQEKGNKNTDTWVWLMWDTHQKKLLSNGKHDDLNHGIWGYPIFTQSHMFRTLANPLVDLSYPSQADGNRLPRGHLWCTQRPSLAFEPGNGSKLDCYPRRLDVQNTQKNSIYQHL